MYAVKMFLSIIFSFFLATSVFGQSPVIDNIKVTFVAVNGGTDSPNQGTTCIKVSATLPAACAGQFVAIKNNNKELISAALHAKATGRDIWLYYDPNAGSNHCPGQVFTPCAVNSIGLK